MDDPAFTAKMSLAEAIYARRSVRAYAPTPVDERTVRALLDAAVQAPSAMNAQPWVFAVVQDVERLRRWSDRAKQIGRGVVRYAGPVTGKTCVQITFLGEH